MTDIFVVIFRHLTSVLFLLNKHNTMLHIINNKSRETVAVVIMYHALQHIDDTTKSSQLDTSSLAALPLLSNQPLDIVYLLHFLSAFRSSSLPSIMIMFSRPASSNIVIINVLLCFFTVLMGYFSLTCNTLAFVL